MQVTPLQSIRLDDLEPTLEEELGCWKKQLRWDYDSAVKLIKRHVAVRALPGFALRNSQGEVVGYGYCLVDLGVGYLGSVYVRDSAAAARPYELLIRALVDKLRRNQGVSRIEGQLFPFNFNFRPIFEGCGFQLVERLYMSRELAGEPEDPPAPIHGYEVDSWTPGFLDEASKLVFASYQDSPDRNLCSDYQSESGCRRFLSNLIAGPGCGTFAPRQSLVLLSRRSKLAGILLTTRIAGDTGMVPQISVHPKHQGKGLGTYLLRFGLEKYKPTMRRVALSVSCQNQGALRLYERLGFRTNKEFTAVIHDLKRK